MNIGEAAVLSGVSAKMIRYYEEILLLPAIQRSRAGYRVYSEHDVHRLRFIRRSRDLGFSLESVAELLALWSDRGRHSADVRRLASEQVASLKRKIVELESMVETLESLVQSCCGDARPECPILADLESGELNPAPLPLQKFGVLRDPRSPRHAVSRLGARKSEDS